MSQSLSLVRSFVLRDLRLNWVRTLLTVLGIALGVAVMLAISLANGTTLSRFQESIDLVAGKSNLEIHSTASADIDEQMLARLQPLWDQQVLFTPVIDQVAAVATKEPDVVQVLGVDMFADPAFRPFSYTSGKDASSDNDIFNRNTAFIGSSIAQRYNLKRGDTFEILANDKRASIKVAGVISYNGPGKAFGGNLLLMDIGPAQDLFGMRGRVNRIDLMAPVDDLQAVSQTAAKLMLPGTAIDRPSRRGAQVQKMIAAFQYNLTALSLVALLVGVYVIYNTMSITVVRKRADIGVLRALGVSRAQVFLLFLIQSLILGTAGSVLGLGAGALFARSAVRAVGQTVQALYADQPSADVVFQPQIFILAFVFGLLMTVVASLAPVFEAMSVPPVEATRRASYERRVQRGSPALAMIGLSLLVLAAVASFLPAVGGFPMFGYLSAALTIFGISLIVPIGISIVASGVRPIMRALFGTEGNLAFLNLVSSLGRTSVTVASLTLGIAMMVSLAIMIGSFRQTVVVWVNQSLKADLYVAPLVRAASKRAGRLSNETVDKIRHIPGVADVDASVDMPIEYNGAPTNLGAGEIDVLARHGGMMLVGNQDRDAVMQRLMHEASCVVSESFSLRNNSHVGDEIQLMSPSGPFKVTIAGIYYDYASDAGYIIIPRWLYKQHFNDNYSTTLGVYLAPNVSPDTVRSQILRALGMDASLSLRTNGELRKEVLRIFDNTFAITYALHAIAISVAILGVMNALFALTYEMRREFAMLQYLGASKRQIQKIILVQAGVLGAFGNVFGVAVGFVLSLLLIHVINKQSFGWTVQLSIPFDFLIQSFILIMIFSIASGWLPARTAVASLNPEVLRVE